MNPQEQPKDNQLAEFGETTFTSSPISQEVAGTLEATTFNNRMVNIVSETTKGIARPNGATVLFNHPEVDYRLAAWPDARLQTYDPNKPVLSTFGFDPSKPLSAMTVMLTDTKTETPVLVRNVLLLSPEQLRQELYMVKQTGKDGEEFVVRNAIDALGLAKDTYAIVPGWSYILSSRRAGVSVDGSQNIRDLVTVSRELVIGLNKHLTQQEIKAVVISQQNGKLDEYAALGFQTPSFTNLTDGEVINTEEERWIIVGDNGERINVFDLFALGSKDSMTTAGFARRSKMPPVPKVAHLVDGQLGPVFLGHDPSLYASEFKGVDSEES